MIVYCTAECMHSDGARCTRDFIELEEAGGVPSCCHHEHMKRRPSGRREIDYDEWRDMQADRRYEHGA